MLFGSYTGPTKLPLENLIPYPIEVFMKGQPLKMKDDNFVKNW